MAHKIEYLEVKTYIEYQPDQSQRNKKSDSLILIVYYLQRFERKSQCCLYVTFFLANAQIIRTHIIGSHLWRLKGV